MHLVRFSVLIFIEYSESELFKSETKYSVFFSLIYMYLKHLHMQKYEIQEQRNIMSDLRFFMAVEFSV